VHSDASDLIGSTYQLGDDELDAMRTGRIEAEVSDLSAPENRFERQYGKLLEVYLPSATTQTTPCCSRRITDTRP
jgi:hypothetical protein